MVPVVSATTVGGVLLTKLVAADRIQAMVERTAKGGGEIVNSLGTSAVRAGRGCCSDGGRDLPRREARAPVHGLSRGRVRHRRPLHGRSGDAWRTGVEAIVELDLSDEERELLDASAAAVREVVGVLTT